MDIHVVSDGSENQSKEVQKTWNTELIVEYQDHDKRVLVPVNIKGISDHREDQDREDQMLDLKESNSHTEDLEERTQTPVDTEVVLDQMQHMMKIIAFKYCQTLKKDIIDQRMLK